jgi:uncharacterized membrane protein YraQ (UPF0718 family)
MTDLVLRRLGDPQTFLAALKSIWALSLAILALVLALDPANFSRVVTEAATSLANTAPYIAIAVLLIAYVKASGAERVIAKAFEGNESRMIVMAALVGGLAPFCSCEVIPFVAGLLAVGVPLGPVMAFWLASPLIDPPQFFITTAAISLDFAIAKTVGAVALGLFGGFVIKLLASSPVLAAPLKPRKSGGCCGASPFKGAPVWQFWQDKERIASFQDNAIENALFLLKWLSLAYILEALLKLYVPAEAIAGVVGGDGLFPIVIGALVGAPAYLNGYAAAPLVAGLMETGMSPGAGLAFMIAGGVSSIPAMAAVYSLVTFRVFALYVALGISGAIGIGVVFQALN